MSGALNAPLIAPEHAARLLDDVLYERVLDCIDLQKLFLIEVELWVALAECEVAENDDAAKHIAKQMIDRALRRLPDDDRRYSLMPPLGPACADCPNADGEPRGPISRKSGRNAG